MPNLVRPRPRGKPAQRALGWDAEMAPALAAPPRIQRIEIITVGDIWGERFHTTPRHELIHVLQGRARIAYRRRSFQVGPGDTFVIPEGTPHRDIREEGPDYRVVYIFFAWPAGQGLLERMNPAALLRAPDGARQHLHLMVRELESEYLGDAPAAQERMQWLLLELLLALARYAQRGAAARPRSQPAARRRAADEQRRKRMAAVKAHLQEHFGAEIGLEGLAERFSLSPFNLSRGFSQVYGLSLVETLTAIRVERAQELMADGGLSLKEIAARVGYANGNYFAKVFRRMTGASPSEYRARRR